MRRTFFKILAVFLISILGALAANQVFGPFFSERPVYVTERNEVTIEENTALKNAVEKVEKAVVGVKTVTENRNYYGSGLVLTSDGLIVTLSELIPQGYDFLFFVEGKPAAYQVIKRDLKKNLALVKLDEKDLSTVGFADFDKLKTGERVFLAGTIYETMGLLKGINEGIVSYFSEYAIKTNISDKNSMKGSPLFNIRGELVGLADIDAYGSVYAIPVSVIRDFAGF